MERSLHPAQQSKRKSGADGSRSQRLENPVANKAEAQLHTSRRGAESPEGHDGAGEDVLRATGGLSPAGSMGGSRAMTPKEWEQRGKGDFGSPRAPQGKLGRPSKHGSATRPLATKPVGTAGAPSVSDRLVRQSQIAGTDGVASKHFGIAVLDPDHAYDE